MCNLHTGSEAGRGGGEGPDLDAAMGAAVCIKLGAELKGELPPGYVAIPSAACVGV
mgnify:CR=1 FL=1